MVGVDGIYLSVLGVDSFQAKFYEVLDNGGGVRIHEYTA